MKFKDYETEILEQCENVGLFPRDLSKYNYDNHSTLEIAGYNEKPVYSGCIIDCITIDNDYKAGNGLIEINVNGYSYRLDQDFNTDKTEYTKAKLFLDGMYWCLNEEERVPVTEQTFKKALERFISRNN